MASFGTVLLTQRSRNRAALAAALAARGLTVVELPLITVAGQTLPVSAFASTPQRLIFVSPAAAEHGVPQLPPSWRDLPRLAVGAATADALADAGWPNTPCPDLENSEGLLALPTLATVRDEQIAIVRGDGGRELLASTLRERGAVVRYLEVYRKCALTPDQIAQLQTITANPVIVVLSSVEALSRLCAIIPTDRLRALTLVVTSARIAEQATRLHLSHQVAAIHIAASAGTDDLLVAINLIWTNPCRTEKAGTDRQGNP